MEDQASREDRLQPALPEMHSDMSWRVVRVSTPGTSHTRLGVPCQDSNLSEVLQSGELVAVVADGAGSATHAELGSQLAVKTVINEARRSEVRLTSLNAEECCKSLLKEWALAARKAVEGEASNLDVPPRELATTLIILIATPYLIGAAQIGDGATVFRDSQGEIRALTTPKLEEYINESMFLSSPGVEESIQLEVWKGEVTQVAVLSDGLQMLALQFPGPVAQSRFLSRCLTLSQKQIRPRTWNKHSDPFWTLSE
jgi:Protein phosphatase 2C